MRLTADGRLQESLGGRADYAAAEEEDGDEAGDAEDAGGVSAGGWQGVQYAAAGASCAGVIVKLAKATTQKSSFHSF